jgi:hypothetical protein
MPPSPVQEFRQWLKMSSAEREPALAARSAKNREAILAKLREYEAMPENLRNANLDAAELHWYLRPLLAMPVAQRDLSAQQIPEPWRERVQARLKQWDELKPDFQKEILKNEAAVKYASAPQPPMPTIPHPSADPILLRRFLSLPMDQQAKAMESFPPAERLEMTKTLQAFRELSPDNREICINSFGKFASMSAREQSVFIKNADRWQAMSSQDRDMWRQLVKIMPPMPSTFPPMPGMSVGTNGAP